jgi:hypothetical protein
MKGQHSYSCARLHVCLFASDCFSAQYNTFAAAPPLHSKVASMLPASGWATAVEQPTPLAPPVHQSLLTWCGCSPAL